MNEAQKQELLTWAEENRYAEIFAKLGELGAKSNEFHKLRREFIRKGDIDTEYNDRLKVFIIDFFEPKIPIISWFKNKKLWAGIFALIVGGIGVWYFGQKETQNIAKNLSQDSTQQNISTEPTIIAKLHDCKALFEFLEKENVVVQVLEKMENTEIKVQKPTRRQDTLQIDYENPTEQEFVRMYLYVCLDSNSILGDLLRTNLKSRKKQTFQLALKSLSANFKTLLITVENEENKVLHYFEFNQNYTVSKYKKTVESKMLIDTVALELLRSYNPRIEKYGFVDKKTRKNIIAHQFYDANPFQESLASVQLKFKGKWGFIDKRGNILIQCQFDRAFSFSEGLAAVKSKGKWGFIDKTGKVVIDYQFDEAYLFQEGLASVQLNKKWGFIDKTGKLIIDYQFDDAYSFDQGLARVKLNKKWGFIDKTGKVIIAYRFDIVNSFHEGLSHVQLNGKQFYINKKGECVKDCP